MIRLQRKCFYQLGFIILLVLLIFLIYLVIFEQTFGKQTADLRPNLTPKDCANVQNFVRTTINTNNVVAGCDCHKQHPNTTYNFAVNNTNRNIITHEYSKQHTQLNSDCNPIMTLNDGIVHFGNNLSVTYAIPQTKDLGKPYQILVAILSYAYNFEQRQWIRNTWLNYDINFKHYFIVADTMLNCDVNNANENQTKLEREYLKYGDLIIFNMKESYNNALQYKSLGTFQIFAKYWNYSYNPDSLTLSVKLGSGASNVKNSKLSKLKQLQDESKSANSIISAPIAVLKTDDDSYVRLCALMSHIRRFAMDDIPLTNNVNVNVDTDNNNSSSGSNNNIVNVRNVWNSSSFDFEYFYFGRCSGPDRIIPSIERDPNKTKTPVYHRLWPYKKYPNYCEGRGYVLSFSLMKCVNKYSKDRSTFYYMPIEDMATGIYVSMCDEMNNDINVTIINTEKDGDGRSQSIWRTQGKQHYNLKTFHDHMIYHGIKKKDGFEKLWNYEYCAAKKKK